MRCSRMKSHVLVNDVERNQNDGNLGNKHIVIILYLSKQGNIFFSYAILSFKRNVRVNEVDRDQKRLQVCRSLFFEGYGGSAKDHRDGAYSGLCSSKRTRENVFDNLSKPDVVSLIASVDSLIEEDSEKWTSLWSAVLDAAKKFEPSTGGVFLMSSRRSSPTRRCLLFARCGSCRNTMTHKRRKSRRNKQTNLPPTSRRTLRQIHTSSRFAML